MSLLERLRRKPAAGPAQSAPIQAAPGAEAVRPVPPPAPAGPPPEWARPLFASPLAPRLTDPDGQVRVWAIQDDASTSRITDQFTSNAEDYHRRYAASDHFQELFVQALTATGVTIAPQPLILDLGSGSGVNSVVPCQRLFPGARIVATDLSAELLDMLAAYERAAGSHDDVFCVVMDAMSNHVAPGAFDFVTGASILHHLERPTEGLAAAARALKPGGHALFSEPFLGWAVVRLAYERILGEARFQRPRLPAEVIAALEALVEDARARTSPDPSSEAFKHLDDKWLFSRTQLEGMATSAGFAEVRFVPHNDHPTLYRDSGLIQLQLCLRRPVTLPDWAMQILDSFDAALPLLAKRELLLEGTIVLTKAA